MEDEQEDVFIKYNFTCPDCKKFLKELLECDNCHKLYCKNCAEERKKNNKKCVFCNNPFNCSPNIGIQRLISNGDIKPKCPYCEKEFANGDEFDAHQPNCEAEHYECRECRQEFKNKNSFWEHLIQEHKDVLIQEMENKIDEENNNNNNN
jgi:hypothetical protein